MEKWYLSLNKFVANDPFVIIVALSILVFALLIYRIWFHSKLTALGKALAEMVVHLHTVEGGWAALSEAGRATSARLEVLRTPWRETEARVMMLPHGSSHVPVMFGPANDVWMPNRLLRAKMNVAVFEAMPNLLVGIQGRCWCGQQWDGGEMCRPSLDAPDEVNSTVAKPID